MSAAPDPALALRLLNEMTLHSFFDELSSPASASLLYLIAAILGGTWCDFEPGTPSGEILEVLKDLACYPLLEPYLEWSEWTEEDIKVLRVKERLKS